MNRENLINCFEGAQKNGARYIGVKIKMPNCPCEEIIINKYPNFEQKLYYYTNAYTEDLRNIACEDIQIVGFTYGDNFAQIQEDLI